jgi:hypothetical protein
MSENCGCLEPYSPCRLCSLELLGCCKLTDDDRDDVVDDVSDGGRDDDGDFGCMWSCASSLFPLSEAMQNQPRDPLIDVAQQYLFLILACFPQKVHFVYCW